MKKLTIRMRCYFYHLDKPRHFGTLWMVRNFSQKQQTNTAWSKCWSKCGKWQKQVFTLKKTEQGTIAYHTEIE